MDFPASLVGFGGFVCFRKNYRLCMPIIFTQYLDGIGGVRSRRGPKMREMNDATHDSHTIILVLVIGGRDSITPKRRQYIPGI